MHAFNAYDRRTYESALFKLVKNFPIFLFIFMYFFHFVCFALFWKNHTFAFMA